MLKFKKIKDKTVAQVKAQDDPCKYAGHKGAYDCLYDCKTGERWYQSKDL